MKMHCVLIALFTILLFSHTSGLISDYHVFGANEKRVDQEKHCRGMGYDGLAVLNTPEKWWYAVKIIKSRNVFGLYLGLDYQKDSKTCVWHDGTPLRSDVPFDTVKKPSNSATAAMKTSNGLLRFSAAWRPKSALCGNYQESMQESWGTTVRGQLNTVTPTILSVAESTYSYLKCTMMCGMEPECRLAEFNSDLKTCTLIGEYTSGGPTIANVNVLTYVRQTY